MALVRQPCRVLKRPYVTALHIGYPFGQSLVYRRLISPKSQNWQFGGEARGLHILAKYGLVRTWKSNFLTFYLCRFW